MESTEIGRVSKHYAVLKSLLLLSVAILLWRVVYPGEFIRSIAYVSVIAIAYRFVSKALLLRHHRRATDLFRQGLFVEAIEAFEDSYSFLSRNPWVDQYRYLLMLDPSEISYREQALCNIGYSYEQMGDAAASIEAYRKAVEEFPDSELARNSLEFVQSQREILGTDSPAFEPNSEL